LKLTPRIYIATTKHDDGCFGFKCAAEHPDLFFAFPGEIDHGAVFIGIVIGIVVMHIHQNYVSIFLRAGIKRSGREKCRSTTSRDRDIVEIAAEVQ